MTKQATLPTLAAMTLSISLVAVPLGTVLGEEAGTSETQPMPMMPGGPGGMMPGRPGGMGMMMGPEMMHKRQEMMQQHMRKMEGHLANIEALLRELVELNKAK